MLREITVREVDRFIKTLATVKSYSVAKQARTVLSLAFGLAVRYDAVAKNPVRDTTRLRKPPSQARALTASRSMPSEPRSAAGGAVQGFPVRLRTDSWSRSSTSCSERRPHR